ncbi:hypothetical protein ACMATS_23625 [Streptoverticillium reticulum]|uniref:hypothetical protein n=1 Tax=Streptoverticillium reticulum TaxID=1433415 RepID=UPI0039BF0B1E
MENEGDFAMHFFPCAPFRRACDDLRRSAIGPHFRGLALRFDINDNGRKMNSATFGDRVFKRLSMGGVAVVTAGAILTVAASTASAAPANSSRTARAAAVVSAQLGTPVDEALVKQLVDGINSARASLAEGQSKVIYDNGQYALSLSKEAAGKTTLRAFQTGHTGNQPRGFCHMSAMAAVYGIGAAAFAAAAAVGGIEVLGIAISADAAGALSTALSAGSGVSALVSQYIC